jgi:predicted transcriptional regulator
MELILEYVNKVTGEILTIPRGGLYAPMPIPAYKVLVEANEHLAKEVLICLISHLGKGGRESYPSYDTISRETGRSRSSLRAALQVLYDFGFVKVYQIKIGRRKRNKYYIQDCCYQSKLMNKKALSYLPKVATCLRCRAVLTIGEIGEGSAKTHHFGCGGVTTLPLS